MVKRILPLGLLTVALLLLGVAVLPAADQNRSDKNSSDKGPTANAPVYDGRILTLDPARREITLAEVRQDYPPVTPIPGLPVLDQGVGGKSVGAKDNTLTFRVADNTRISLDGHSATLGDLRADMWAKVWTRPAPPAPGVTPTADRIEATARAPQLRPGTPR